MPNELIKKAIDLSKGTCKNQYMGSESLIFGVTNENQNEVSKILDYSDKLKKLNIDCCELVIFPSYLYLSLLHLIILLIHIA